MNNKRKKKKNIRRVQAEPIEPPRRLYSPEDKAALTCGRICGRSNIAQQDYLEKLGVPRQRSVLMTKYIAAKEIDRRLKQRELRDSQPCLRCGEDWRYWNPVGVVARRSPAGPICTECLRHLKLDEEHAIILTSQPTYARRDLQAVSGK